MIQDYPYYKEMQTLGTQVIGVWDDHDFGVNDGGKEFPLKKDIRPLFLDAIGEPQGTPRRLDSDSPIH